LNLENKNILITGSGSYDRDYVVVSAKLVQGDTINNYKPEPEGRMLRNRRFKYWILNEGTQKETLYDLLNDPGEMVNIATDPKFRGDLENCRTELTNWAKKNNDQYLKYLVKK